MIIYGASGHGKVIIEILELNGLRDIQVWDDKPLEHLCGYTVTLPKVTGNEDIPLSISIGKNDTRKAVAEQLPQDTLYYSAVHPGTTVSTSASIDRGTVV